mmetsp:Transcript_12249/g.29721  ORF Transcript_12249/g.29721 Transcript_12249/m.29721 type:complete len:256 (-) Transcript_12249:1140-1907(-)
MDKVLSIFPVLDFLIEEFVSGEYLDSRSEINSLLCYNLNFQSLGLGIDLYIALLNSRESQKRSFLTPPHSYAASKRSMVSSRKTSHEAEAPVRSNSPDPLVEEQIRESRVAARIPARRHAVIFTPEQAQREFALVQEEFNSRRNSAADRELDRLESDNEAASSSDDSSGRDTPQRTETPRSRVAESELRGVEEYGINEVARQLEQLRCQSPVAAGRTVDGEPSAGRATVVALAAGELPAEPAGKCDDTKDHAGEQ